MELKLNLKSFRKSAKKFISICMTMMLIFTSLILPLSVSAKEASVTPDSTVTDGNVTGSEKPLYQGTCGDNLRWYLYETGLLEITGTGSMRNFYHTIDYAPWYSYRSYIKTVNIGDFVTSIGKEAFYKCYSLTSITIPDSVTRIGSSAFNDTAYYNDESNWTHGVLYIGNHLIKAETTISGAYTIKPGTKIIADGAFSGCESLTSITIPDSVTGVGSSAFDDTAYYNDESNWTHGVLYIGNRLIEAKTSISGAYTIKPGTKTIVGGAFYSCESLTSITIPDSVISIGDSAFSGCDSLTSVIIGNSVTSIGDYAFECCFNLTSVTIGNSVTSIGDEAFCCCYSLTSITIPDSVTSIGDGAFYYCKSLTNIKIPDSVTSIGYGAFDSCESLISLTIPDSVTSIGSYAFRFCCNLTSITIGNSVTSIGESVFSCCCSLTSITVAEGNANYLSDEFGVLFNKDKTQLIQYQTGNTRTSYTIPDSVTSIGGDAFRGCQSLTSITIGNSVTRIGDCAFFGCQSLTSITIPDSVTSIGGNAFYYCNSLKDVYYGATVSDWNRIIIGSENSYLINATRHYNVHIHSYTKVITKEPTCTEKGIKMCTCECGDTYETVVSEKGHRYNHIGTIAPTCTKIGMYVYKCSACNEYLRDPIDMKAHDYSVKIERVEPTCIAEGYEKYKCSGCTSEYTKSIPVIAHNYTKTDTIDPTCTVEGYKKYKCSGCGDEYTSRISALGHSYNDKGICTACGNIYGFYIPESSSVVIDREKNLISGLETGLDKDGIMEYISISDDTSIKFDREVIGTGTKITVTDNATSEVIDEYTIVIFGDYNGDGVADSEDTGYFSAISNFEIFDYFEYDYLYMAGDINGDGVVDSMDEEDMNAVANFEAYIDYTITEGSKVVRY